MSFGKLQSMGGNYVSRLGGADILSQDQLQSLSPQELQIYNQQKEMSKTAGMRELASRLSDAFAGRDIVGRAAEREKLKKGKSQTLTAGRKDYEYFKNLLPAEQEAFLIATGRQSPELAAQFRKAKSEGGLDLTPLQKDIDKKFATTAESWLSKDAAQVDANIMNLEDKIGIIERGEADVSGKLIGITPEFLQPFVGQTEAKAFLGDVRDIVFQSLKEKLGAQFTEKEGDRLVAAAYDPSLPEELNAKRLRRLLAVVKTMKASKEGMIDFYNKEGTLKDYEPPKATFNNIYDALVEEEFASKTNEELVEMYSKTKDLDKKTAILRYAEKLEKQQGI
jgi:hypothetical protein